MGGNSGYLAHGDTPFDLKDSGNNRLGAVRASGAYLTEQGGAGTLRQIDVVVREVLTRMRHQGRIGGCGEVRCRLRHACCGKRQPLVGRDTAFGHQR